MFLVKNLLFVAVEVPAESRSILFDPLGNNGIMGGLFMIFAALLIAGIIAFGVMESVENKRIVIFSNSLLFVLLSAIIIFLPTAKLGDAVGSIEESYNIEVINSDELWHTLLGTDQLSTMSLVYEYDGRLREDTVFIMKEDVFDKSGKYVASNITVYSKTDPSNSNVLTPFKFYSP